MAPKRKQHGEFAKPEEDTTELSSEFSKPVYLVALREDEQSAYSILKIDAAAVAEAPRAHTVAGLPGTARGMSFVAAHSKHGSWIVGVGGGLRAGTIIFDPSTLKTYQGPRFLHPKQEPVVISHRGEVYALSRRPRVVPSIDFEPWFESLSFNKGVPSSDCGAWAFWSKLPPPPFFPSHLNPYQFRNPTEISITSYAAVGSHILFSPQPKLEVGTYAFHVVNKTWEKVHQENLPFVGQAVPLGGSLFAACPISENGVATSASVFHMSINVSSSTSLLIQEFPVSASEDKIPQPLFCPLGKGSFCSIRLSLSKQVEVILTVFQINNIEATLTACQSQSAEAKNLRVAVQVKEQSHTYKAKGQSHMLGSDMSVVAALSMDTENIEILDGETTETRGSLTTDSPVIVAPVIRYWTQSGCILVQNKPNLS